MRPKQAAPWKSQDQRALNSSPILSKRCLCSGHLVACEEPSSGCAPTDPLSGPGAALRAERLAGSRGKDAAERKTQPRPPSCGSQAPLRRGRGCSRRGFGAGLHEECARSRRVPLPRRGDLQELHKLVARFLGRRRTGGKRCRDLGLKVGFWASGTLLILRTAWKGCWRHGQQEQAVMVHAICSANAGKVALAQRWFKLGFS